MTRTSKVVKKLIAQETSYIPSAKRNVTLGIVNRRGRYVSAVELLTGKKKYYKNKYRG